MQAEADGPNRSAAARNSPPSADLGAGVRAEDGGRRGAAAVGRRRRGGTGRGRRVPSARAPARGRVSLPRGPARGRASLRRGPARSRRAPPTQGPGRGGGAAVARAVEERVCS